MPRNATSNRWKSLGFGLASTAITQSSSLISIAFIHQLVDIVDRIADFAGIGTDDYTPKLAVFHSIFTLIGVAVMFPLVEPLVRWLDIALPERLPEVDQPRYLSRASAEYPDSATEAVRKESIRVHDAARRIIAAGLDIERPTLAGPGARPVARPDRASADIDAAYEKHIKVIYSAIVAFIGETAFARREEQGAGLRLLREANARTVEAVKDAKHLQKNLLPCMRSSNDSIARAYPRLRNDVADVLESLQALEHETSGEIDRASLDALVALGIDRNRAEMIERMIELIGRHRISPGMGSSLLNDSAYAHAISRSLIRSARILFDTGEGEAPGYAERLARRERGDAARGARPAIVRRRTLREIGRTTVGSSSPVPGFVLVPSRRRRVTSVATDTCPCRFSVGELACQTVSCATTWRFRPCAPAASG